MPRKPSNLAPGAARWLAAHGPAAVSDLARAKRWSRRRARWVIADGIRRGLIERADRRPATSPFAQYRALEVKA